MHNLIYNKILSYTGCPLPPLGADPNKRVRLSTPLHMAAQQGDTKLVHLLLLHGANPTPVDSEGRKPADFAPTNSTIYKLLSAYTGRFCMLCLYALINCRRLSSGLMSNNLSKKNHY